MGGDHSCHGCTRLSLHAAGCSRGTEGTPVQDSDRMHDPMPPSMRAHGQTRVPTSSELGWGTGVFRLVVGRKGDRPVARVTPDGALEPLTADQSRGLFNALAREANRYSTEQQATGDDEEPVEDPDTAGEDATFGPPSVADA